MEATALHPVPRSLPVQAAATMVIKCAPVRAKTLQLVSAVATTVSRTAKDSSCVNYKEGNLFHEEVYR